MITGHEETLSMEKWKTVSSLVTRCERFPLWWRFRSRSSGLQCHIVLQQDHAASIFTLKNGRSKDFLNTGILLQHYMVSELRWWP